MKIFAFAVAGFSLPVYAALHFAPTMFRYGAPPADYFRASLALPAETATAAQSNPDDKSVSPQQEPQSNVLTVPSDSSLDPKSGKYFVVSLDVKILNLPRTGRRQKLISKYSSESSPYPGWAIGLRRLNTSTRPEVYWQSGDGKGGWYTFDHVRFEKNKWYSLTLLARDGELMSLYAEPLEPKTEPDPNASENLDETASPGVRFLGGYSLSGVQVESTPAAMEFSPPVAEYGDFRGQVRNILVATPEHFPKQQEKIRELLAGGTAALVNRLEASAVSFFVDEKGSDRSRAQRAIVPVTSHT